MGTFGKLARAIGIVLLVGSTLVGGWAILQTLQEGHINTAATQHVPWGLWVTLYLLFLGMSAGTYLLSSLIYVFGVKRLQPAGPVALLVALICLLLGGVFIMLDLGHPLRMFKMLFWFNPTSVMAWMGMFYLAYSLIIMLQLHFALRPWLVSKAQAGGLLGGLYGLMALGRKDLGPDSLARDKGRLKVLGGLGIPVVVLAIVGEGMVFAVAKARPNWFGGLFPVILLVSALASGGALLTLLAATTAKLKAECKLDLVRLLARLTVGILGFDLLMLTAEVLTTLYGGIPHEVGAWRMMLFGPYRWVFWGLQIGLGALLPTLLVLLPGTGKRVGWLGLAGFLAVVGMVGTRWNIVIPAQISPAFDSAVGAYNGPRFELGYLPSTIEWLVPLGVLALGIWIFVLAYKLLPLDSASHEVALDGGK